MKIEEKKQLLVHALGLIPLTSSTTERVRRHRERLQLELAHTVEEQLLESLPRGEVAARLAKHIPPRALDAFKWDMADLIVSLGGNKKRPRKQLDAYFTKPPVAAAVTKRIAEVIGAAPRHILEPSAGLGAFVRVARETWPAAPIWAVDVKVRKKLRELEGDLVHLVEADFLTLGDSAFDLVIGNPPFDNAEAHVDHAMRQLGDDGFAAFILRQGFAAGLERARGLWARPGHYYEAAIAPRPSFLETGTDHSEYALFVWRRGYTGPAIKGKPIIWRDAEQLERGAA